MKKIKLDAAKLQLHKEKIASLTGGQMGQVLGGAVGDARGGDGPGGQTDIAGTRVLCFASKADNCSNGSCGKGGSVHCLIPTAVFICIPL